jgi:transmembrane sensor
MPYSHHIADDFALDNKFQQWVLNPDENNNRFWQEWMNTHPEKRQEIEEAIELVRLAGLSTDYEANTRFLQVWHRLQTDTQTMIRPPWTRHALRYAAVFIGLVLVTGLLWKIMYTPQAIAYKTAYGETKEVVLPDGSKVMMNANSQLQLPGEDWGKYQARVVMLEGEAFFEITRTPDRQRFIVQTPGQLDVEVLGTEFNVNTRRANTWVYLQSGSVRLRTTVGEATLEPGQLGGYDQQAKQIKVSRANGESWLAWKDHLFAFDDEPLSIVGQAIEDHFGTKVIITDAAVAQQRFTGKLPRTDLDVVLKVLAETLKIEIVRQNGSIIMRPGK